MIRIKAPRIKRRPFDPPGSIHRGRWISEAMYRSVVALVRACEQSDGKPVDVFSDRVIQVLGRLRIQAQKEAKEVVGLKKKAKKKGGKPC